MFKIHQSVFYFILFYFMSLLLFNSFFFVYFIYIYIYIQLWFYLNISLINLFIWQSAQKTFLSGKIFSKIIQIKYVLQNFTKIYNLRIILKIYIERYKNANVQNLQKRTLFVINKLHVNVNFTFFLCYFLCVSKFFPFKNFFSYLEAIL